MHIDEYRKLAEVEDNMWYFHALNQRILLPLAPWRGRQAEVLDAGCGTGGLIRALHDFEPLWLITGLDFSPVACSLARERTGAKIVEGSITQLPFADQSFDIVTNADVISQVEDPSLALSEFFRVLRPGGVLVINVAAYRWMWSYHDDTCETRHRFRRSELVRMVQESGLRLHQASYVNMFVFPFIIARRKLFPPSNPTSDVKLYSPTVENVFGSMASLEHFWLSKGFRLPTGSSIFLSATKP